MLMRRDVVRIVLGFALLGLAAEVPAPAVAGGPISEMLAKRRMQRQMQLPPMDKPFSTKPVKDISPSRLSSQFRKRFSLKKPDGSSFAAGFMSGRKDDGVTRTSR